MPSEVVLEPGEDPVPQRSAVNLDSVESVSLGVLVQRLGRLADARMREICAALAVAVHCRFERVHPGHVGYSLDGGGGGPSVQLPHGCHAHRTETREMARRPSDRQPLAA